MNSILAIPSPPHHFQDPWLAPSRSSQSASLLTPAFGLTSTSVPHNVPSAQTNTRKRKAEDDEEQKDRMITPPPPGSINSLPHRRNSPKRSRTEALGRPLALPRLLETLDVDLLRSVLQEVCTRHPSIAAEVEQTAPRPSVTSALAVLRKYQDHLQMAFPFGGDHSSDYAYNRVRTALMQLLDALADYVPHFLPPNETQSSQTLDFLDGATTLIHSLPDWESYQNNLHKQNAYDEIARAWKLAVQEGSKRAGGMQLKYDGWESKLQKHNATSGGRLQEAVQELNKAIEWMGQEDRTAGVQQRSDLEAVRQELLSGNYGSNVPVRVGPW